MSKQLKIKLQNINDGPYAKNFKTRNYFKNQNIYEII